MSTFLGVDGGGSKTRFLLIDDTGRTLAVHDEGSAYHPEIGLQALAAMLARGVALVLARGGVRAQDLTYAFFGLPCHGEDRALELQLDALPAAALPSGRFRCGNDMICGWAGALAGEYGINVVAGTGSIAYGEYAGQSARAGGWGELFSDEGSAYWIAREGLRLFSRMADGRAPRSGLYELIRKRFGLTEDIELCAAVYGKETIQRSQFAQLSKLVAQAALSGDSQARAVFNAAAGELADLVDAVRLRLQVPPAVELPVSCTGGLFELRELLMAPFGAVLASRKGRYRLAPARLTPEAGAALYAARLSGMPLAGRAIEALSTHGFTTAFST
ncbi:MAG: BadF/BadG/BcrA/BcrD ATPase family protein [Steroidobacteraceae bacterium]